METEQNGQLTVLENQVWDLFDQYRLNLETPGAWHLEDFADYIVNVESEDFQNRVKEFADDVSLDMALGKIICGIKKQVE